MLVRTGTEVAGRTYLSISVESSESATPSISWPRPQRGFAHPSACADSRTRAQDEHTTAHRVHAHSCRRTCTCCAKTAAILLLSAASTCSCGTQQRTSSVFHAVSGTDQQSSHSNPQPSSLPAVPSESAPPPAGAPDGCTGARYREATATKFAAEPTATPINFHQERGSGPRGLPPPSSSRGSSVSALRRSSPGMTAATPAWTATLAPVGVPVVATVRSAGHTPDSVTAGSSVRTSANADGAAPSRACSVDPPARVRPKDAAKGRCRSELVPVRTRLSALAAAFADGASFGTHALPRPPPTE